MSSRARAALRPATAPFVAGLAVVAMAAPSFAQSLDYDTFEQMFNEPVTASATGKPQRVSDAPVNMEIITQDDIRRSGATSIPDVLQYEAGVDVRHYGIAAAEVGIRGYNQPYNPRLLVMVNGRQVYSDDYGHVAWPTIPVQLAEIRQIEVIKGPNSALYGFNAVSGVINIITYDPLRNKVNTATLSGGTQSYLGGSAVGTGQIGDRAGLRISVGGFHANDYPPGGLSATGVSARRSPLVGAFNVDGRVRIAPGVEAFAEASMGDSRYAEKDFVDSFDTTFARTNSLRVGLSAETAIGQLNVSAYRNEQHLSLDLGDLFSVTNRGSWATGDVYVVQVSDLVKLGTDHTIRLGLEYRNNTVTSPGFFQGTIGYDVYAASAMWSWQLTPRLSLTNAARVDVLQLRYSGTLAAGSGLTLADYNSAGFTAPSFNSGLVFQASDKDTVRLVLARGVQAPSLVDFGFQVPLGVVGPVVVAGNPNLHPSTVDNIELDYDRALPAIGSVLRTAVFAQSNRDLISQSFAAPPTFGPTGLPLFLAANVGHSEAVGAEIGVKGHSASGLRWNASYAFVATTDHTVSRTGPDPTSAVAYAHSVPQHVVSMGIGYTWQRLELDVLGRWQSSYRDFQATGNGLLLEPVDVQNYITLSARAAYRLTDSLTLAATAQQFNASSLLVAAGPRVERRVIGSVTAHF